MIHDVIVPQLAMGMSEGTIVEWAVAEGGRVTRDLPLVAIETEKVVTELPAPYSGFVHLLVQRGETLPVETVIARIADSEEEYRALLAGDAAADGGDGGKAPAAPLSSDAAAAGDGRAASRQAVPQAAPDATREPAATIGVTATPAERRVRASGLAKALARRHDIDLLQIPGSGPGGRIVRRDVIAALEQPKLASGPAGKPSPAGAMRPRAKVPLTGMRAAIAQRMLATKTTAAQTYGFFEVDLTKLLAARKTILDHEEEPGTRISLLAFYARAIAVACRHVPICNATLANDEITLWENVNVGIAVALPGRGEYDSGLIVPVVRDVQAKGLLQIDREIKDLVKRARASELSAAQTADGTITISSTDGFLPGGWMVSTPLLNLPQVVNFQPSTPVEKAVVVDGQIVARTMLPCGFTFDHRAMDGEPIGRFVRKMRDLIANPELLLL